MKKNMSGIDRIARVAIAIVIAALYFTGVVSGTTSLILLALAVIFLLTSAVSYCPIYQVLGIKKYESKS